MAEDEARYAGDKHADIGWLIREYDRLLATPGSRERDQGLSSVERSLLRVSGAGRLAAAVEQAREQTGYTAPFEALTPRTPPDAGPRTTGRRRRGRPAGPAGDQDRRDEPDIRAHHKEPARRASAAVPRLDEETALRAEELFARRNWYRGRRLSRAQQDEMDRVTDEILDLTGFRTLKAARAAVEVFIARELAPHPRKYVKSRPYFSNQNRPLPPVRVVLGGSPGGGRRA